MQLTIEAGETLRTAYTHPDPSQANNESKADWCNEKLFQRNRLPPRSYFLPDTKLCLNGEWLFNYAPTPYHSPDVALCSGRRTIQLLDPSNHEPSWATISVPGHWQLQGYGRPQYTNIVYPFPACPPHAPTENPTGTYHREFTIPSNWDRSSHFRLRFDGVDSAFYVWFNGHEVGYSQGSRNPAEFDVTEHIKRGGSNVLVVKVLQWCSGSYIEDQDQWWLSGSVELTD
jgi:beta-galactosidase